MHLLVKPFTVYELALWCKMRIIKINELTCPQMQASQSIATPWAEVHPDTVAAIRRQALADLVATLTVTSFDFFKSSDSTESTVLLRINCGKGSPEKLFRGDELPPNAQEEHAAAEFRLNDSFTELLLQRIGEQPVAKPTATLDDQGLALEINEEMLVAGLKECEPLGGLIDWEEGFGRKEMRNTLKAVVAAARPTAQVWPLPEEVFNAAWACPHNIDSDKVVLRYNSKVPGKNALSQLHQRIIACFPTAAAAAVDLVDPGEQSDDVVTATELREWAFKMDPTTRPAPPTPALQKSVARALRVFAGAVDTQARLPDPIGRSKVVLALLDEYAELPTRDRRNLLRTSLLDIFVAEDRAGFLEARFAGRPLPTSLSSQADMNQAWLALRPEFHTPDWSPADSFNARGFFGWGWEAARRRYEPVEQA